MVIPLVSDPPLRSNRPDLPAAQILLQSQAPTYLNSDHEEKLQLLLWLISATLPEFNHLQAARSGQFLRPHQRLARLILHNVARNCARRDRQRRSQIHLSRTAAPREVAVLRADHNLIRSRRNTRPRVDARSATRLDHNRPSLLEYSEIALAQTVLARLLRSKLNVELHRPRHVLALLQSICQHGGVHIHVFVLARGAGATVSDFDR